MIFFKKKNKNVEIDVEAWKNIINKRGHFKTYKDNDEQVTVTEVTADPAKVDFDRMLKQVDQYCNEEWLQYVTGM